MAEYIPIFTQILVALVLGFLIGAERSVAHKTAGMRTYGLVSMGSCLLVIVSSAVTEQYIGIANFDPLRLAAGIVTGIGFLGAGMIIFKESKVSGLTTAAGLWVACAIGIAVGFNLYAIAVFTTVLTLLTFTAVWVIEKKITRTLHNIELDSE